MVAEPAGEDPPAGRGGAAAEAGDAVLGQQPRQPEPGHSRQPVRPRSLVRGDVQVPGRPVVVRKPRRPLRPVQQPVHPLSNQISRAGAPAWRPSAGGVEEVGQFGADLGELLDVAGGEVDGLGLAVVDQVGGQRGGVEAVVGQVHQVDRQAREPVRLFLGIHRCNASLRRYVTIR